MIFDSNSISASSLFVGFPRLKGLPKVHKEGMPMRPIITGIGSAPHKLAKVLAKPLTKALGTISDAHVKNSTEVIEELKRIQGVPKLMSS